RPDVMTLAKALGNGVPIGACLAGGKAAKLMAPGNHGSTFGGNPLACAAANAVLDVIESGNLLKRAATLGERMRSRFHAAMDSMPEVRDIRGRGLMIGIELDRDCPELVGMALERRLLINVTAGRVIRLLPAYIISDEQADQIVDEVVGLVQAFLNNTAEAA
ncbi:MAG: aminotransferase class III-fold pyridoxal phosphate-dependent enzyme, partial [Gammaproteobacteria bacterium]